MELSLITYAVSLGYADGVVKNRNGMDTSAANASEGFVVPVFTTTWESAYQILVVTLNQQEIKNGAKGVGMENEVMKDLLRKGECVDVGAHGLPVEGFEGTVWELPFFRDGAEYCYAAKEQWVWSIGKRRTDGRIFASLDTRFYGNPMFECLWLR